MGLDSQERILPAGPEPETGRAAHPGGAAGLPATALPLGGKGRGLVELSVGLHGVLGGMGRYQDHTGLPCMHK